MKPVLSHTVERFLKDRGKQKIVLFGISGVCLVALVAVIAVGATVHVNRRKEPGNTDSKGQELSASAKAIQSLCQYTDYNDVCEDSLMKSGANTTDPKELIKISFGTASQYISEAAKKSDTLKEIEQNNRTSAALDNCKEMLEYAINDLKTCSDKLDESKIMNDTNMVEDLRIWISAAITYQETCLDGFENTTGDAADTMEDALKTAGELTSNSLAMITEISSILSSFQNFGTSQRHLLQHQHVLGHDSHTDFMDYPPWISHGRRRLLKTNQINPQVTVAKDGSGDYISINDALKHVLRKSNDPYIIYIKKGIYKEQVIIEDTMTNVILIGDGPRRTRITGSLNFVDGVPTCQTATVIVIGDFFMAKGIAFENTAGTEKHQAVALRVQSDFSVFYNCHIDGYQDTLYVHTNRQFYRDCVISGTIDFIFGDAAAVLQNCRMFVRKPLDNQFCAVTAQGRKDKRQPTGILIQGGEIVGAPDYLPEIKTYLGRPWKAYSRTVIMETFLDSLIAPEGWTPWQGNLYIDSCFYAEFNNNGPGSSTDQRVKWPGIKTISPENLYKYTPGVFIGGNQWIPQKGVPYNSELMSSKP